MLELLYITTVNVQHIESLNDVVENITNVSVKETIPDYILIKRIWFA